MSQGTNALEPSLRRGSSVPVLQLTFWVGVALVALLRSTYLARATLSRLNSGDRDLSIFFFRPAASQVGHRSTCNNKYFGGVIKEVRDHLPQTLAYLRSWPDMLALH